MFRKTGELASHDSPVGDMVLVWLARTSARCGASGALHLEQRRDLRPREAKNLASSARRGPRASSGSSSQRRALAALARAKHLGPRLISTLTRTAAARARSRLPGAAEPRDHALERPPSQRPLSACRPPIAAPAPSRAAPSPAAPPAAIEMADLEAAVFGDAPAADDLVPEEFGAMGAEDIQRR